MRKVYPKAVDDAVKKLESELPMADKVRISNILENALVDLHFSLGMQIRYDYGLWAGNKKLLESCRHISGEKELQVDDASSVIIRESSGQLRKTNHLRIIK